VDEAGLVSPDLAGAELALLQGALVSALDDQDAAREDVGGLVLALVLLER
jgi:hypothetical protein